MSFVNLLASKTLKEQYFDAFLRFDRWKLYMEGLENTLIIALFAIVIGIIVGVTLAVINYINKKSGKLKILSYIANAYITIIRGTPVVLQMLIMFTVVFVADLGDIKIGNSVWKNGIDILVGGLTFGLNSGAYVAEIARAGFESVDDGQREAGRSLGMSTGQTMISIIVPQAMRNVLPPLFNEFITLIKETAIVGYVGVMDLGRVPSIIATRTFDTLPPLIISACVYLILVMMLTILLRIIEKQLSKSDRNAHRGIKNKFKKEVKNYE